MKCGILPAVVARSSSGLGRRPFKAKIMGSNPIRATIFPLQSLTRVLCHQRSLVREDVLCLMDVALHPSVDVALYCSMDVTPL